MKRNYSVFAGLLLMSGATQVLADGVCEPQATIAEVRASYAKGQSAEKAGDGVAALAHYVAAQLGTCDANPVAGVAAARGAVVAKPLGDAAKARGDHGAAYDYYERGGHFAAADRELVAWTEVQTDDSELYWNAFKHFDNRNLLAFREGAKAQLAATGEYSLDASLVARVNAMPAAGLKRVLETEAAAFNEEFLQKYIALVQSRPEDPLDMPGQRAWAERQEALKTQYPRDYLRESQDALGDLQGWAGKTAHTGEDQVFTQRQNERAALRLTAVMEKYSGAPELLDAAKGYVMHLAGEWDALTAMQGKIRERAEQLGDAAYAAKRYFLAADYYSVADATDKANRVKSEQQAYIEQQMKPTLDAARRDADALRAQFGDANQIAEMQRAAREMQRQFQQGAAAREVPAARASRDDLAKELGL